MISNSPESPKVPNDKELLIQELKSIRESEEKITKRLFDLIFSFKSSDWNEFEILEFLSTLTKLSKQQSMSMDRASETKTFLIQILREKTRSRLNEE